MTPPMYGVLAMQWVIEVAFMVWGVNVRDSVYLVAPFVLGITILAGVGVMDLRRGEEDGGLKGLEYGLEEGMIGNGEIKGADGEM